MQDYLDTEDGMKEMLEEISNAVMQLLLWTLGGGVMERMKAQKILCPICEYQISYCQCLFSGWHIPIQVSVGK